ncbi:MFS transporter [Marinobacterium nitratireducens]|uniref:MFS transporter n=1 Tax=Marinobacterium nitratireducens TaxID=518897 RepID=A0A918DNV5_9GAMM|nr:MFS transporter [Marinobacterium nitratireducens]GGO75416.1 MFS transporter [Marinobacterium nitratireducens]
MSSLFSVRNPRFERWRWQIFAVTWLAYAAFYFTRKAFSVAKIGIEEDSTFELTREMMANIDASYLIAYAIGQFMWGMFADRFGTRAVVLGGLIASVVAAVVMGLFHGAMIFLIFMFIQGLAQSTGWSSLCKNVGNFFSRRERGRVMGLWCTNYAFGGLVATPFAGWVAYDLFNDWRLAFFACAAVVGVVALLILLFQRNKPEDVGLPAIDDYHREPAEVLDLDEPQQAHGWAEVKAVLSNRIVLLLGLIYFLLKPARYAILLWGPYIVYQELNNVSKLEAAAIPAAFEFAGLFGPIILGFLSDKLFRAKRMPVCAISLLLLTATLAAFIPAVHSGSIPLVVGMLFLIGITLYGPDSMISGSAAVDFGTRRGAGTATGFVNGCGSIGAVLGGLLPGYFETEAIFTGFAVCTFIGGLLLLPLWHLLPNSQAPAQGDTLGVPAAPATT